VLWSTSLSPRYRLRLCIHFPSTPQAYEGYKILHTYGNVTKYGIGPLVNKTLTNMYLARDGFGPFFRLLSGHDTAPMMPLLCTCGLCLVLDAFRGGHVQVGVQCVFWSRDTRLFCGFAAAFDAWDGHWTWYASLIAFELYELPSSVWAVRMIYNGKVITMPGCSSSLCPFDEFEAHVNTIIPSVAVSVLFCLSEGACSCGCHLYRAAWSEHFSRTPTGVPAHCVANRRPPLRPPLPKPAR